MARKHKRSPQKETRDVSHLANGGARRESRRGVEWYVRDVPAHRAEKQYRCPSCSQEVPIGQPHVVAWQAEGVMGADSALRDRRHYHAHCWRLL